MRQIESILADVQATDDELFWLHTQDAKLALAHPNCPAELWWRTAETHPIEAMESPLYPLLTLESPERWVEMERENLRDWIHEATKGLDLSIEFDLFAADCAEHVLPVFEEIYPEDKRPRAAVNARRNHAWNLASYAELVAAQDAALQAERIVQKKRDAADRRKDTHVFILLEGALQVVRAAINNHSWMHAQQAHEPERHEERVWQWSRVRQYLRGEVR
jgi:hypothetical protein